MFCAEVWRHPAVSHISMLKTQTRTVFTSLSASLPVTPPPTPPGMSARPWTRTVNMTFCTNVSVLQYVASAVCGTRSHTLNSSVKVQSPHFISCNTVWEPLEWKRAVRPVFWAGYRCISRRAKHRIVSKKKTNTVKKHFEKKTQRVPFNKMYCSAEYISRALKALLNIWME